ncbi:MAG: hypothetical protein FH753_07620 [Firmicutes bacterium]|nr:hypothetical protein [Bacillota bacterium]
MKKASRLLELYVLSKKTGEKIASIKDIIYSKHKQRILGFIVKENNIFKGNKVIRFKNIKAFGDDVLMVKDKKSIERTESIPEIFNIIKEGNDIIGEEVLCEDGESLGYIKDVIYEEKKGKILAFLLTDGVIQDVIDGRNILPNIKGIKFLDKSLVIDKKIKDDFTKNKEEFKKLLEL